MSLFSVHTLSCPVALRIPTRSIHTPRFPSAPRHFEHAPAPAPSNQKRATERRLINRQIPFDHVYVLDPETHKLSPTKQPLDALLAARAGVVELVTSAPQPIVRVTTRAVVEARYREMRRGQRKEDLKEVHLAWGVAPADVAHKLRKARRDLDKGCRVVVVVTFKRRQRPSGRRELVAFADEISGALAEVGVESKEREFSERSMTMSFQKAQQEDGDS